MLSYIEISKKNLLHNFRLMKTLVRPGVKIAAVIKANAYGHGQNEVAKILEKEADYFQVDDIEELRLLRKVSKKETFVFGYVPRKEMAEVIELGGILCAYDRDQIFTRQHCSRACGVCLKSSEQSLCSSEEEPLAQCSHENCPRCKSC